MNKLTLTTLLAAIALFLTLPLQAAEGTAVQLMRVPGYVQRLLVPVLPSAVNTFRIAANPVEAVLSSPGGYTVEKHLGGVRITAPAGESSGYAKVRIGGREVTLTLVNLVPYTRVRNGFLEGYRMGEYRLLPPKGLSSYERPKGFMRLSNANREIWVSDHYRMRDFQCKLDGGAWKACSSPKTYRNLKKGRHTIRVRAIDKVGNVDASPAVKTFRVR